MNPFIFILGLILGLIDSLFSAHHPTASFWYILTLLAIALLWDPISKAVLKRRREQAVAIARSAADTGEQS